MVSNRVPGLRLGVALLTVLAALSACGDDGGGSVRDSGPSIPRLTAEPLPAYEGQRRYVGAISGSVELAGATLEIDDPSVRVVAQRCGASVCGVVLEVDDTTPNEGLVVPRPIRSRTVPIRAVRDGRTLGELALPVFFLDALRLEGNDEIAGSFVASSLEMPAGSARPARAGVEPFRVFVTGATSLHGELDFAARDRMPRGGGGGGGDTASDGEGTTGGRAGSAMGGGGGGGHATEGSDGTGAGGGRGGVARRELSCLSSVTATGCGGGGGGGAGAGTGGAGGGALFIASLAPLDASGLVVDVRGAPGAADGGGGGGGGFAWLAAPGITGSPTIHGAGGAGDGAGGGGGRGWARLDGARGAEPTLDEAEPMRGPAISIDEVGGLETQPMLALTGTGEPGREVVISTTMRSASATADDAGRWSATLELVPGLNRIRLEQRADGAVERGWSGTSFEFDPTGHPVGAFVDVVYVP